MPAVEQVDPEKLVIDWLAGVVGSGQVPELIGWKSGTLVEKGVTPVNFVQVRLIGGVDEQRVASRPRLDLRMWGTGELRGEGDLKRAARKVMARLRRDLPSRVLMEPTPLPDPADSTKTHVMFSVELLTRGVQVP